MKKVKAVIVAIFLMFLFANNLAADESCFLEIINETPYTMIELLVAPEGGGENITYSFADDPILSNESREIEIPGGNLWFYMDVGTYTGVTQIVDGGYFEPGEYYTWTITEEEVNNFIDDSYGYYDPYGYYDYYDPYGYYSYYYNPYGYYNYYDPYGYYSYYGPYGYYDYYSYYDPYRYYGYYGPYGYYDYYGYYDPYNYYGYNYYYGPYGYYDYYDPYSYYDYYSDFESDTIMGAAIRGDLGLVQMYIEGGTDVNEQDGFGKTALMAAAGQGHQHVVDYLIENGADVNIRSYYGETALSIAANASKWVAAESLIIAGANVNDWDDYGTTPLIHASARGDSEMVLMLLNAGADPNAQNDNYETPLILAAAGGYLDVVGLLQSAGAELYPQSAAALEVLNMAIGQGSLDAVKTLLDLGIDISMDIDGVTPFSAAISSGSPEMVRLFLDRGADIHDKIVIIEWGEKTVLSPFAALLYQMSRLSGRTEVGEYVSIAKSLMDRGAEPDVLIESGGGTFPAIAMAVVNSAMMPDGDLIQSLVDKMIAAGVDVDKPILPPPEAGGDILKGPTTLMLLAMISLQPFTGAPLDQMTEAVKTLIDAGADVNRTAQINDFGEMLEMTPLWMAIMMLSEFDFDEVPEMLDVFVDAGADVNHMLSVEDTKTTMLNFMALKGKAYVVEWLLKNGADAGIRDSDGKTALDIAKDEGHSDIIRLLK